MFPRLLLNNLSRNKPFCLFGARGVGKTTLIGEFAGKFSNFIHLDLETEADRAIFNFDVSADETLRAISFLKGTEIRGSGTLIVLDEIGRCAGALRWVREQVGGWTGGQVGGRTGGQVDGWTGGQVDGWTGGQVDRRTGGEAEGRGPMIVAVSSVMTKELAGLTDPVDGYLQACFLFPFSFEEFLIAIVDEPALEAFREVPVPFYAYEKLLNHFHLYSLIGGMPEITAEYASSRHLAGLKQVYRKIENRFIECLPDFTPGAKSRDLTAEVLQNTYPFAATRISFNRFGNLDKGSREISQAFKALESIFFLQMIYPGTSAVLPVSPDQSRFPRLQLADTGLVNFFSGIQKPLFQSHDMNAIFEGQIARQVVGQEILAAGNTHELDKPVNGQFSAQPAQSVHNGMAGLNFWTRDKIQSTAEVDFVLPYNDLLIPVVVRSGEPGRLRSLHQFIDAAPHAYAIRLYAGKLTVLQTQTLHWKKFFLLNLPYFLAGKIREYLNGFIRLANG